MVVVVVVVVVVGIVGKKIKTQISLWSQRYPNEDLIRIFPKSYYMACDCTFGLHAENKVYLRNLVC